MLVRDDHARHCPLCGIAMRATRTEQRDLRFDCLSCHTAILERPVSAPSQRTTKS
jgi:hypothetical protein